jgi:hypothetical protein
LYKLASSTNGKHSENCLAAPTGKNSTLIGRYIKQGELNMTQFQRSPAATLALALLGGVCGLHARPVTPDPSDCFLTLISDKTTVGGSQGGVLSAMSGDGHTALLRTSYEYSDLANGFREAFLEDEFLIRDGVRTLLTHYIEHVPTIPTDSLTQWKSVDLPFDGSFAVTTKGSGGKLLSLPGLAETATPLSYALKVSSDGTWVVGSGPGRLIQRWNRRTGVTQLVANPGASDSYSVKAVSLDGNVICGEKTFLDPQAGGTVLATYLWKAGEGETIPKVPAGFRTMAMDGSGTVLAGYKSLVPMLWSQNGGAVPLSLTLDGQVAAWGQALHISGDGQLVFGTVSIGLADHPVVWQRDGTAHALTSLIRGVDLGNFVLIGPDVVSRDGRTVGGSCYQPTQSGSVRMIYIAGLALPGEGPKATVKRNASGGGNLGFHAKSGFTYQVQSATDFGSWTPLGTVITGNDADHSVPVTAGNAAAGFFRVLVNP